MDLIWTDKEGLVRDIEAGGSLGGVCSVVDVTTVNKWWEYMRKLPGWGIHVGMGTQSQSFRWPGAALLQNIGSRVGYSHTIFSSVQAGFLTLAFCSMSKIGAEICLLLWAPGGNPTLKLREGWLFSFRSLLYYKYSCCPGWQPPPWLVTSALLLFMLVR